MASSGSIPTRLEPWLAGALPVVLAGCGLAVVSRGDLDARLVDPFFEASTGSWPHSHGFWAQAVFHQGGRALVFAIAAGSLLTALVAGRVDAVKRSWRWPALYFLLALGLSTGLVAVLKSMSWVPCPWKSVRYGGDVVHGSLWMFSPGGRLHGRCHPAAHASSGFALMALYYVFRAVHIRVAWFALGMGGSVGCVFAAAQVVRGAHYPSHALWSLVIVWSICTALYWVCPSGRFWRAPQALHCELP